MKTLTIIRMFAGGLAAALVLVVLGSVAERSGTRNAERSSAEAPTESGTPVAARRDAARRDAVVEARSAADPGPARPRPARADEPPNGASEADERDALTQELQRMSAGYRNRIFLQAIRDRGHYCDGIVDTQLGGQGVAAWRVACGGVDAYLIGVGSTGGLIVEPLYYGDGRFWIPTGPTEPVPMPAPAPAPQRRVFPVEPR